MNPEYVYIDTDFCIMHLGEMFPEKSSSAECAKG